MDDYNATIIPREQIPPRRRSRHSVYQEWYNLVPVDGNVLKLMFSNVKMVKTVYTAFWSANARARRDGRSLPYPGLQIATRGNEVFLWIGRQENEHHD